MTCSQCPHCLAEIARLDGELAKAREDNKVMAKALRAMGEMGVESDEAADSARAEVSRLKAGLVVMRENWRRFDVRIATDIDALLKEPT